MPKEDLLAGVMGLVVADALGVPVEFETREELKKDPVKEMREYGTYDQPQGTWSDDSSLTLCLMESLCDGYDLADQGAKFIKYLNNAYLTPHGETFDIGNITRLSIRRLENGVEPIKAGGNDEDDNGNGSVMRILPLVYYVQDLEVGERLEKIAEVSSLTHAHPRAILGCGIYVEFALNLFAGFKLKEAYSEMKKVIKDHYNKVPYQKEMNHYKRILEEEIDQLPKTEIRSSGYVVETLEAVFWVLFNSNSYKEAVLKAVNLGEDTDTIAAIVGSLAGIYYGYQEIPDNWIDNIVKKDEILEVVNRFHKVIEAR